MQKFLDLLKRFRRDERGAFLAMFGILAVVLIATAGATVDFTSVQNARTRAQVALDAAALALQPEIYKTTYTTEQIRSMAEALMLNRLGTDAANTDGQTGKPIVAKVTSAVPSVAAGTLSLTATVKAPLYFVSLVGISNMSMTLVSQATKGSQDLEVAVALDVTGSMDSTPSGSSTKKIDALITAANSMVDILVLDNQTPTYTKMALVPWSMGVNLGANAANARGAVTGPKTVTSVAWLNSASFTIAAITKASSARITTTTNHGFNNGDVVWISGITAGSSFTNLNGKFYTVTKDVGNSARFYINADTSGYSGSWSAGGGVRKCLQPNCELVVSSTAHGFTNNQAVYFKSVGGTTALNSNLFTATSVTTDTFVLSGTDARQMSGGWSPSYVYQPYTAGGSAYCVNYGCQYYRFQNPSNSWKLYEVSNCVTERTGTDKYTDTAPGTAPVGINYPADLDNCLSNQVVPLTSDKTVLHAAINSFKAVGSTAGQVGTAWAWYMLSPSFASLWPADNQPAAYNAGNLIKVVVLMTDGSFNSIYCNGVISEDSTSGSGSSSEHIGCNAQNGNPFTQAKALCDAMKLNTGIIVYTVGFDVADQTSEKDMLSYCATDSSKYFLANDGTELTSAFTQIAQDIAQLRLSL
jgi:Flp pilus assembly protein TadG